MSRWNPIYSYLLNLIMTCLGERSEHRQFAVALRVNSTVTSLQLGGNKLGEGGAQAIAVALRVKSTVTSLHLGDNWLGEG
jgi:hypothetical protein